MGRASNTNCENLLHFDFSGKPLVHYTLTPHVIVIDIDWEKSLIPVLPQT